MIHFLESRSTLTTLKELITQSPETAQFFRGRGYIMGPKVVEMEYLKINIKLVGSSMRLQLKFEVCTDTE